ncbi:hypothetical protein [Alkalinema sp. FACHB-956]|uniref:hypothetical protein n=1 Tax=Alkalinema sp. FACHB-956 TaxID=2692768 RepID=UPI0016872EE1|nr:hypothetical protein [Alkalinema sp. FACHB-956]MBD2326559.1 hypothetical protein [Alkalinema sp. FACHB-956]
MKPLQAGTMGWKGLVFVAMTCVVMTFLRITFVVIIFVGITLLENFDFSFSLLESVTENVTESVTAIPHRLNFANVYDRRCLRSTTYDRPPTID